MVNQLVQCALHLFHSRSSITSFNQEIFTQMATQTTFTFTFHSRSSITSFNLEVITQMAAQNNIYSNTRITKVISW